MADTHPRVWAAFFEAVHETSGTRHQWLLLPPSDPEFGSQAELGEARFLRRTLRGDGSKRGKQWESHTRSTPADLEHKLVAELEQHESAGHIIRRPVVLLMELDDYAGCWQGGKAWATPYKTLRQVEAVTKKWGYRLTVELPSSGTV